jgi:acyl carrier protein
MWDSQFEQIIRTVVPELPPDEPLSADLDLGARGLNSMGIMRLLLSLERTYGVEFPDDNLEFAMFATPAAVWTAVSRALLSHSRD